MTCELLLQNSIETIRKTINQAEELKNMDIHSLKWKENETSWNILECLEHLNLYGDYYFTQIEIGIKNSSSKSEIKFKTGVLGNYFAKSMLPKEKLKRMKTFKDKNPLNKELNKAAIDRFISQQLKFLELLSDSRNVSLNKVKITTSISKLIRLRLGDTFQFLINHIVRHFAQIERIKAEMKNA